MRTTNEKYHAITVYSARLEGEMKALKVFISMLIKRRDLLTTCGEAHILTATNRILTENSPDINRIFTQAHNQGAIHFHKFNRSRMTIDFDPPEMPESRAFVWYYLTGILEQAREWLEELELQREIQSNAVFHDTPYTPAVPQDVLRATHKILLCPTN